MIDNVEEIEGVEVTVQYSLLLNVPVVPSFEPPVEPKVLFTRTESVPTVLIVFKVNGLY